ncbi:MAG: pyridoxal phosphate-dependent aminotransferase family protein [Nanoarchaeota archaeon]
MSLFDKCTNGRIAEAERLIRLNGFYPFFVPIQSEIDSTVMIDGQEKIMLGSNNYVGLTSDPRVKEAAIKAIEKYGSGCTGSRLMNGTLDLHVELEEKLAKAMKKEAALVYSTGFQTNLGVISALVNKGDAVIIDRADHASIVDACRLSFGDTVKFRHNDMEDLERVLIYAQKHKGRLVVIDGIFSMEGDIARLPEIVRLCKKYDAAVMVDDAHGIGVLGKTGMGTCEHFQLEDEVDIIMGTFSKSFASLGGFIAAKESIINYIKHVSRPFLFSASIPPAQAATAIATLDIIQTEPERRSKLWANTYKMKEGLSAMGYDTGVSETPIIPVIIGEDMRTFQFWKVMYDAGVFTNAVVSPAVPEGHSRLRTSYMATHTEEILERALAVFEKKGREMGIIR